MVEPAGKTPAAKSFQPPWRENKTEAQLKKIVENLTEARKRIAAGPHDPKQLARIDELITDFSARATNESQEVAENKRRAAKIKELLNSKAFIDSELKNINPKLYKDLRDRLQSSLKTAESLAHITPKKDIGRI